MSNTSGGEQLLEQKLAVFRGMFSLEAAQAVFAEGELEMEQLANLLDRLEAQGKLQSDAQDDHRRYWLSEEQRQLGRVQLAASGAEDTVYSQLVDYYLELARQSLDGAFGPERALWISRLEQEHINIQPVFEWLVRRGDADRGLRLAYLLQELWFEDPHTSEARTLFDTLLALPIASPPTSDRARYFDLAGAFALSQNDYTAARALKEEGIAICQELDDHAALGSSLIHLGHVEFYAGDFVAAQKLYREALQIFTDLGDETWIARAIGNLGNAALELGDYVAADPFVRESLLRYQDLGLEWELAGIIGTAAGVAAGFGQAERAIRLAGASAAHRERIGVSVPPLFEARFERMIVSARQELAESMQAELWDEGRKMSLEQATEYGECQDPCVNGKEIRQPADPQSGSPVG